MEWYAGFSAFRIGDYENAANRLEILAASQTVPNYLRSQAAFWAARAHMRSGDPQRVVTLLTAAAHEQPTFYGMLDAWKRIIEVMQQSAPLLIALRLPEADRMIFQ